MTEKVDQQRAKSELERRLESGVLTPATEGQLVPRFNALDLAQALEREINHAGAMGFTKIRLDMLVEDAAQMAAFLRRAAIRGRG